MHHWVIVSPTQSVSVVGASAVSLRVSLSPVSVLQCQSQSVQSVSVVGASVSVSVSAVSVSRRCLSVSLIQRQSSVSQSVLDVGASLTDFYVGSFSYTSRAGFIFMRRVSLTHPVLASFLCGDFLLHIPCWLNFYAGSFSYTSRAVFFFYRGSFSYTSHVGFIFIWGVFLTHSRAGFIFTHPMMTLFLCREFLLHIPCCLDFYAMSSSCTSRAGFFFIFRFF